MGGNDRLADEPARIEDVHEFARSMPFVTLTTGTAGNPIYQVGGRSFVFFRNPRPDAVDPVTGARYGDIIVIWVDTEGVKQALVQDPESPFFSTPHFDGHLSVLVRAGRLGELTRGELAEVIHAHGLVYAATRAHDRKPRGARVVDPMIAATALANDLPLFTRNPDHFDHLEAGGL